jgi:hypothetical protein
MLQCNTDAMVHWVKGQLGAQGLLVQWMVEGLIYWCSEAGCEGV